jgi:hypothetical protein
VVRLLLRARLLVLGHDLLCMAWSLDLRLSRLEPAGKISACPPLASHFASCFAPDLLSITTLVLPLAFILSASSVGASLSSHRFSQMSTSCHCVLKRCSVLDAADSVVAGLADILHRDSSAVGAVLCLLDSDFPQLSALPNSAAASARWRDGG